MTKESAEDLKVEYGCEQTQIYSIIKQKEAITETNASSLSHSLGHRCQKSTFSDINDHLYLLACSKNIYHNGPTLKSKAQEIAAKLEIEGFKASNCWFDKWKHRHSIKRLCVCGEPGDVSDLTDSWKDCLPEILANYKMEDIYNIDETGCFWCSLPDKGIGTKTLLCKGGKKFKT
uniref:HTH CENPB-type domain-containing protein n=1 Tax=Amphimedon queenslandica TaxID=400682 RepID=A0A1X7UT29_AMPQE